MTRFLRTFGSATLVRRSGGRWLLLAATAGCLATGPMGAAAGTATSGTDGRQLLAACKTPGGLVVLVGSRDSALAVSLGNVPNVLVHVLVRDQTHLATVRTGIREARLYGRASAMLRGGDRLPYADGMVNLLVVASDGPAPAEAEINRVLAPLGTAWLQHDGGPTSWRKPWPDDVDVWSHARYDASGNAVSKDQHVGPPRYLQWEAKPRWNRGTKTSCVVSTPGRVFYILDDAPFAARTSTWSLIARDAANGIRLWRHELPSWEGARGGKKVGPAQVNRRLVALGDRVYATLGEFAPVSVMDAATGKILRVLEHTERTEEFLVSNGVLVALVNPNTAAAVRRGKAPARRVVALAPETGKLLWQQDAPMVLPLTLTADGNQLVYHDGTVIRSYDLRTGAPRWTSPPTGQKVVYRSSANPDSPGAEKSVIVLAPQFAPTLIIYGDVVAFAGGRQLNVVSAADGRELWRSDYAPSNYSVPVDLFGFEGCLWGPAPTMNQWRPMSDEIEVNAYDLATGAVKRHLEDDYGFRFQHHRCHQMKVVGNTVIAGRAGIEFFDTDTGEVTAQHWTRGSCYYGVLPTNGRLYVPPHNCACYIRAKLSGFLALNAAPPARTSVIPEKRRLQQGPAYELQIAPAAVAGPDDWPTYRHDMGRSGRTTASVGSDLLLGWQQDVGGKLTSPVIAGGRLYLASTDAHQLHALDAATGKPLWQYTFDARVDSPPTVYEGLVLCGCRDGTVHALRASDGQLVWRFAASPEERLIVSRGQLESVWPVYGSVLVLNDRVYFAAGRSSYLDGGIRLYGLEPRTGRKVVDTTLWSRDAHGAEFLDKQGVDGFLSDILSSDGRHIFMRHQVIDLTGKPKAERVTHLHGPDGYLSAETTSRLLWTYAPMYTSPHQGAFYDTRLSRVLFPSGRILVESDDTIYGFGQNHYDRMRTDPGGQWALFAAEKKNGVPLGLSAKEYRKLALSGKKSVHFRWWKQLPMRVWAMVETADALFVGGPPGGAMTTQAALTGKIEGSLIAVDPAEGRILAEMSLPSMPVWDGMAVAGDSLFVAMANGKVMCLWAAATGRPGTPLSPAAWRAALPPAEVAAEPELVGRWRFDEGHGMLARDCSGRGHDADVSGRWTKRDGGTCLVADGVPRAAAIPDAPDLHFGNGDFSLVWWVQVEGYGVRLLGKEAFPQNWWVVNLLDDGRVELVLGEGRGPGKSVRPTSSKPLPTKTWTHLAAVVDRHAGEVRWYLNGMLDSRQPIPESMNQGIDGGGSDLAIPSSYKPFRGLIGDLRIYRKAISAQQVKMLYGERATGSSSDTPR